MMDPIQDAPAYRVLARKYRPRNFAELIGHDTLVRTLSNAFSSGRIAHAFMLTGVRGVGKTTTARIVARALNCVGPDGKGGPSMQPCGVCDPCRAITEDRHPDVLEMDAASRTGVDDIREVIDSVRYRPVSARFKIYIIDEVHMLSRQAFNALLKTLEEPPPDIKFIFATTEINKVPVTVLSRCQRYTLPRIPADTLSGYYAEIAQKEAVAIEPAALALIARAADGSVRDGLSILDQAIALGHGALITAEAVRQMLGAADRGLTFDLFEAVMTGDAALMLGLLANLYNNGTDPVMVLQDLLEITHFITRLKLDRPGPSGADNTPLADGLDRARGGALAARLGIAALSRAWQMLLKGLAEVQTAPQPLKAAEMALIRLIYVADLPPPAELLKALQAQNSASGGVPPREPPKPGGGGARLQAVAGGGARFAAPEPAAQISPVDPALPQNFAAVMALIATRREGILEAHIQRCLHLVRYEPGRIEFRPTADAPRDLATRLGKVLTEATGQRWVISVSQEPGAPTLAEQDAAIAAQQRDRILADPLVRAILARFPGAALDRIIAPEPAEAEAAPPEEEPPALYEEDDPGPFAPGNIWDIEED